MWSGLAWLTAPFTGRSRKPPGDPDLPFPSLVLRPPPPHRGPEKLRLCVVTGGPTGLHSGLPPCRARLLSAVGLPQPPDPHLPSTVTVHTVLVAASFPARPRWKFKLVCGAPALGGLWASPARPHSHVVPPIPAPSPGSLPVLFLGATRPLRFLRTTPVSPPERSCTQACYRDSPQVLVIPVSPERAAVSP